MLKTAGAPGGAKRKGQQPSEYGRYLYGMTASTPLGPPSSVPYELACCLHLRPANVRTKMPITKYYHHLLLVRLNTRVKSPIPPINPARSSPHAVLQVKHPLVIITPPCTQLFRVPFEPVASIKPSVMPTCQMLTYQPLETGWLVLSLRFPWCAP